MEGGRRPALLAFGVKSDSRHPERDNDVSRQSLT